VARMPRMAWSKMRFGKSKKLRAGFDGNY
jgi:hypothetical protein